MFNSPLTPEKADRIIALLKLSAGTRVVDVGCGTGEFLLRVMERYDAYGVGIDPDSEALARCRDCSTGRVLSEHLSLHQLEVAAYSWPTELFDAAICIGASHAFGGYADMLQQLSQRVKSGGFLIVGDLYWRKEPAPEYLRILGSGFPSPGTTHATLACPGVGLQLQPLYCTRSSDDEWDDFEGRFAFDSYFRALSKPDKSGREQAIAKCRLWYDAYLRWGHFSMGFGCYVFLKTDRQVVASG